AARVRAAEAKEHEEAAQEGLELTAREAEQRVRRAGRGAEREELLAALEELAAWYRDLVAAAAGASGALVHADRAAGVQAKLAFHGDSGRSRTGGHPPVCRACRGVDCPHAPGYLVVSVTAARHLRASHRE